MEQQQQQQQQIQQSAEDSSQRSETTKEDDLDGAAMTDSIPLLGASTTATLFLAELGYDMSSVVCL